MLLLVLLINKPCDILPTFSIPQKKANVMLRPPGEAALLLDNYDIEEDGRLSPDKSIIRFLASHRNDLPFLFYAAEPAAVP